MKKVILISSLLLATALAANAQEIFDSLRPAATTSTSISETTVSLASDISNREDRPSRKGGPSDLLAQSSPQVENGSANASTTKVLVPEGNPIVVDGIFSKGEWDDAFKLPISEDYNLYLKVVSGSLCIGLKSPKPIGMLLTEIYITSNEKEFYNLHSSASLGEGVNPFPSDFKSLKFSVHNNKKWEANCDTFDKVEEEKWNAAGEPNDPEKYDKVFYKKDGKEFRIDLNKFSGARLKIAMVWRSAKGVAHFPDNLNIKSWDSWTELIFPPKKKSENIHDTRCAVKIIDRRFPLIGYGRLS
jgi:hypothetical protein